MRNPKSAGRKLDKNVVILDRNLFDEKSHSLDRVDVVATLLQGEAIFDPSGLFED